MTGVQTCALPIFRHTGLTLTPKAGTQRLRDVINKGVTEEALLDHVSRAFSLGWQQVKLYFMMGTLSLLIDAVNRQEKPVWIRQVIVPGFNDDEEYIRELNKFLKRIKYIRKIELLGYHNMAEPKYDKLGIKYRLKGVKPMDSESLKKLSDLTEIE